MIFLYQIWEWGTTTALAVGSRSFSKGVIIVDYLVDYLTFSHKGFSRPEQMLNFLGIPNTFQWEVLGGNYGYKESIYNGGIRIYYNAEPVWSEDRLEFIPCGVCFSASGTGCRTLEFMTKCDWVDVFQLLLDNRYNEEGFEIAKDSIQQYITYLNHKHLFKESLSKIEQKNYNQIHKIEHDNQLHGIQCLSITRLDIACDEKEGILPIKPIMNKTNKFIDYVQGNTEEQFDVCTKFEYAECQNSSKGVSVYYGSPQSQIRIRIYDKAAERGFKDQHWVRCEMQLRDERAMQAMEHITMFNDVGQVYSQALNNYLRFVVEDSDRNSRCSSTRWWQRFLDTSSKLRLFVAPGPDYNRHRLERYLKVQAGNSLYTYLTVNGGDVSELMELIKNREYNKLSSKQRKLIEDAIRAGEIDGHL